MSKTVAIVTLELSTSKGMNTIDLALRMLLKRLKRTYGIKAESCRVVEASAPPPAVVGPSKGFQKYGAETAKPRH